MMRVLFWMVSFLPDIGGIQMSTLRLAKRLKKMGCEVVVLTKTQQPFDLESDISVIRMKGDSIFDWTGYSGEWIVKNARSFDIIHVIDLFYQSIERQFYFLNLCKIPSVLKIPTAGYVPLLIDSQEKKEEIKKVDAIIALNEKIEEELVGAGVNKQRIHAISNGVDKDEFFPSARSEMNKKRIKVIYAGRIVQRKRIDVLLEVAKKLKEMADFYLVGSGFNMNDSTEDEVISVAKTISNVYLLRPQIETLKYYQDSDVNILISEREGQPNSILEGMSCGLPTVATNIPGITNLITSGKEGLLLNPGDVFSTRNAIEKLFQNPKMRQEMGFLARERVVKEFDIGIVAQKYYKLYEEIIKNRKENRDEYYFSNTL